MNISIDDFRKCEIKIGTVLSVEKIENADKLLKLIFDFGDEQRQIMSAIALFFPDPQVLVGKQMPVLVNLETRNFRGFESQGMILAADVDGIPILLAPEKEVPAGSSVM